MSKEQLQALVDQYHKEMSRTTDLERLAREHDPLMDPDQWLDRDRVEMETEEVLYHCIPQA